MYVYVYVNVYIRKKTVYYYCNTFYAVFSICSFKGSSLINPDFSLHCKCDSHIRKRKLRQNKAAG